MGRFSTPGRKPVEGSSLRLVLIKCQYGDADGHVGDYELDIDGAVTIRFQKYLVTKEEVNTSRGLARVATWIWD